MPPAAPSSADHSAGEFHTWADFKVPLGAASDRLNKGQWICLDWKTGEMKYADKGVGKGSATYAEGMLYTLSESHHMGLVKATPDGHEMISRFEIPDLGKSTSRGHPVICGGRLYIRHNDYLYAYDVKAK